MKLWLALVYTALWLGANAALAGVPDVSPLAKGSMKKLVFHEAPVAAGKAEFLDATGTAHTLAEYRGKWVLLNFWATWCPPCRKEMPAIDALAGDLAGEKFAVVTIATGRNRLEGVRSFFAEIGVKNLPILLDPRSKLASQMGVRGLPTTVILDPEGREVARMIGDADWNSESARAIIKALIASED